jgi:PAS domain S-box-containing protein
MLVAIFLWFTAQFGAQEERQREVEKAQALQAAIAGVISDMKDAETGQRGFVITGNPAFLEPYRGARQTIGASIARLKALSAHEQPEIRIRVNNIAALIPEKFVEMEHVLAIHSSAGRNAAASVISQGLGKQLMDRIRTETLAVQRLQDANLTRRIALAQREAELSRLLFQIGMIVATTAAFVVACLAWSSNRARHKALFEAINASVRQAAIFNSALNAIVLINPSGSIEIMNPAAERLFGYPATDLLRRDISIIADLAPGSGAFLDRIGLGPAGLAAPFRSSLRAHCADGGTVPVEVALGLMPLEDGMHIVAVFSDLTEREKVDQIKDQFLATVSHELRTPLTSIVGSLGLLKAGIASQLSPQADRLVNIAENNANRLIRIVNDILDAEKLQSGEMSFSMDAVDLRDVVKAATSAMTGLAGTKAITIDVHCPADPAMVNGDSERLIQVVTNLLSNAIKFSPPASRVTTRLSIAQGDAKVAIADEGPGIPDSLRDRLFTRFAQSPSMSSSGLPGTGLGLAIARDIVEAHRGRIGFDDNAPNGTVFTFELPLRASTAPDFSHIGAARLLLLTTPEEATALSPVFAALEIRADVVSDAEDAVREVEKGQCLAMVMDFRFADAKAREIIAAIRAAPTGRNLPIIGIAGDANPSFAGHEAALDIVDWLATPLNPDQIIESVSAALTRALAASPLVLHVDDDPDTLQLTAQALVGLARVEQATDLASARAFLAANQADILVVDIALPDGSGLDLIVDSCRSGIPVIIYSAQDARSDLRDVEAVLTKSKKSLPNLVDTILAIRTREQHRGIDERTA